MLTALVCVIQVTMVAAMATTLSAILMRRQPHVSAWISLLGVALCWCVVTAHLGSMPRLWTLAATDWAFEAVGEVSYSAGGSQSAKVASQDSTQGLQLSTLLRKINSISYEKTPNNSGVQEARVSWLGLLVGAILPASLLFWLVRFVIGSWGLVNIYRHSRRLECDLVTSQLQQLVADRRVGKPVRLKACDQIESPCVSWLTPNTIYVPSDFENWTNSERAISLAHELTHLQRRDAQMRLLFEVLAMPIVLHPLRGVLRRQMCLAQELATDRSSAELVGGLKYYIKYLSMLTLRMDSQRRASFVCYGVSVSTNNVVRRIKMLNSVRLGGSSRNAVVVCAGLVLASFAASAWTAKADDTIRIASRTKRVANTGQELYQGKRSAPWEMFGQQEGYFDLQVERVSRNNFFKTALEATMAELSGLSTEALDLTSVGLSLDNVQRMHTSLKCDVRTIPKDEQVDGNRNSISFGSDCFHLTSKEPVGWKKFADEFTWVALGPVESMKQVAEMLSEFDGKSDVTICSEESKKRTIDDFESVKALWSVVDRGAMSVLATIPSHSELNIDAADDPLSVQQLEKLIHRIAASCDVAEDGINLHAKLALQPKNSSEAAQVLDEAIALRSRILTAGRLLVSSLGVAEKTDSAKALSSLIASLETAELNIVESNGFEFVELQLKTNVDLALILNEDKPSDESKEPESKEAEPTEAE